LKGFNDPRLKLVVQDGVKYLASHTEGTFDVIIVDSSDPIGPASVLFEKSFYEIAKKALKPNGIICSQSECIWLHLDLIKSMLDFSRTLFPNVDYGYTTIPTYPSGQIGFLLCSLGDSCKKPKSTPEQAFVEEEKNSLRYYNSAIHEASFVLPQFAGQKLA